MDEWMTRATFENASLLLLRLLRLNLITADVLSCSAWLTKVAPRYVYVWTDRGIDRLRYGRFCDLADNLEYAVAVERFIHLHNTF